MGGRESLFGAEFDSLADMISFGMAPALLMFYLILSPTTGSYEWFRNIGWLIGFIYLLCAAMRLARFNVITNPLLRPGSKDSSKDFVGLPVPAAASTVAATVLFLIKLAETDRSLKAWALTLPPLMLLVAVLMMSTVRYPSGKNVDMQTQTRHATVHPASFRHRARGALQRNRRARDLSRVHFFWRFSVMCDVADPGVEPKVTASKSV